MDFPELRAHLTAEAARFRAAALAAEPDAVAPTCPEWTATDLIDHLTGVYDHKLQSMRLLREPAGADRIKRTGPAAERFDAALADLLAEFDDRGPESLAHTWYGPDQTVGFWIRRMAHETAVHRVDAELAAGRPVGAVDAALALDGIEEMLTVMLSWGSKAYRDWTLDDIQANLGLQVGLDAGDRAWTVIVSVAGIDIADDVAAGSAATVAGTPGEVLLWLWRRLPADALAVTGDRAAANDLYDLAERFAQ
ncbi:maleylpyruvate isomerase family mycothiol-dependent enzyme [Glycomyces terrestris]|uniref:Maleylpyruvate isomerase family mycothiol-dependent enzyme n=1 Tax=Glycomyces terrestris TaxID=2493553 RepID=A0A426UW18_9ACTN|nr:maleylpyruvate isomerase family mycothiol-dependent enzyme [Glycomyces terrestris]RRR98389.1 maleylpyruvate isomerase family mycothiol-dependent enzyme [Glycomyces terrestris]